ncbi:MAG: riboflavin biosynthesis protein RibF [Clostridiales bacterium]|nr:riboflavin biosynthesis protein RibF [Clostridiales bacterium]
MEELTRGIDVCLALGYFDSVHLGHRRLIETASDYAKANGLKCAVATFTNNAYKVFNPSEKAVYTYAERTELLDGKCDYVLPMRFDTRLKKTTAKDFLDGLMSAYSVKAVVCGYDYLFGAGAEGDAEFLKSYCAKHDIHCIVMDKFELNGHRVSTTVVKELLAAGNVEEANAYLGEPFMLTGKVVHGRGAGRMFDIPTANIKVPNDKLLPSAGVYGTVCVVDGAKFYGATNIGSRPTFGLSKVEVETMLKDFDDNIYDKQIKLYFCKWLREVQKFDTPALLSKQVHDDINWSER